MRHLQAWLDILSKLRVRTQACCCRFSLRCHACPKEHTPVQEPRCRLQILERTGRNTPWSCEHAPKLSSNLPDPETLFWFGFRDFRAFPLDTQIFTPVQKVSRRATLLAFQRLAYCVKMPHVSQLEVAKQVPKLQANPFWTFFTCTPVLKSAHPNLRLLFCSMASSNSAPMVCLPIKK